MGAKQAYLISKPKMQMKETGTPLDDVFQKPREIIDNLFAIKDPLKEQKQRLMIESGFYKVPGSQLEHALRGYVYALAAYLRRTGSELAEFSAQPPFLQVDREQYARLTLAYSWQACERREARLSAPGVRGLHGGADRCAPLRGGNSLAGRRVRKGGAGAEGQGVGGSGIARGAGREGEDRRDEKDRKQHSQVNARAHTREDD